MGLTGELVRNVFSKNHRSFGSQDSNVRSYNVERRKWTSVRSYLCGDELNSMLAEDDSASIRSSEATVTQPLAEEWSKEVEIQSENKEEKVTEEKHNSLSTLLTEENAAIRIQSAFRQFLAKRREGGSHEVCEQGLESPSRESLATSLEAQTGGSVDILIISEEPLAVQQRMQQKARSNVTSRLKEDWDDSTVSSNISRLRIQNRLEATTRRERALAYAFSQQLRICAKRKPSRSDTFETNMGWNWLERWMATKLPDNASVEDRMSIRYEPIASDRGAVISKRNLDVGGEEKESCGSNEVPIGIESLTAISEPSVNESSKPVKSRFKAGRTVSRRKTVPSNHCPKQLTKVSKKGSSREAEKKMENTSKHTKEAVEVTNIISK